MPTRHGLIARAAVTDRRRCSPQHPQSSDASQCRTARPDVGTKWPSRSQRCDVRQPSRELQGRGPASGGRGAGFASSTGRHRAHPSSRGPLELPVIAQHTGIACSATGAQFRIDVLAAACSTRAPCHRTAKSVLSTAYLSQHSACAARSAWLRNAGQATADVRMHSRAALALQAKSSAATTRHLPSRVREIPE